MNIPFKIAGNEQPLLLVPVFVNDRGPYDFVLDTGAAQTLISLELAQHLGIKRRETKSIQAIGAAGQIPILLGSIESLSVGTADLKYLPVMITDLHVLSEAMGTQIEGDLGTDYLTHFCVTIHYQQKTLCLEQSGEACVQGLDTLAEIHFPQVDKANPLICLPTWVNGQEGPYTFVLDTATSTTALSPELAQSLNIKPQETALLMAGGGGMKVPLSQVGALTVGTATVHQLHIMVADFLPKLSQVVGMKLDGILGFNYLSRFVVMIDYPAGTLRLVLVADAKRGSEAA